MIAKIILLGLMFISLGMNLAKHGEEEVKTHNGWTSFASFCIVMGLLYWGGFFNLN